MKTRDSVVKKGLEFNFIAIISPRPVHLSMLFQGTSGIYFKSWAALLHSHCQNSEQRQGMTAVAHNDCKHSVRRNYPVLVPAIPYILFFNTLKKKAFRKHWKKMKLLKMSNFTFSHNNFYSTCILKSLNGHISVVVCSFFEFMTVSKWCIREWVNPLPHMPILVSSNSAANKGMMSKILTNGDTIF